jgi:phage-related protein
MAYQAIYYRQADGTELVLDYIDSLSVKHQVSVLNQIERLNLCDDAHPHLPFPHSSQIDGELRELRCHRGRDLYRVLYRRSGRFLSCSTAS